MSQAPPRNLWMPVSWGSFLFFPPCDFMDESNWNLVKRRFVRQNREIARVNSIQSLRIRSLESEVSHLLSENVSLREQSISLGQELERYEAAKMLHDSVHDIKAKLDGKLAE